MTRVLSVEGTLFFTGFGAGFFWGGGVIIITVQNKDKLSISCKLKLFGKYIYIYINPISPPICIYLYGIYIYVIYKYGINILYGVCDICADEETGARAASKKLK